MRFECESVVFTSFGARQLFYFSGKRGEGEEENTAVITDDGRRNYR